MPLSGASNLPSSENSPSHPGAPLPKPPQPELVIFSPGDLPAAEKPSFTHEFKLEDDDEEKYSFVAVPESGLVADMSSDAVQIYSMGGDGGVLHYVEHETEVEAGVLASLGGDVIVFNSNRLEKSDEANGNLTTCRASTGERLSAIILPTVPGKDEVTAIAAIGDAGFVVGTLSGHLIFYTHSGGSDLKEIARNKVSTERIDDIAVCGDVLITTSRKTAVILSVKTNQQLAVRTHDHVLTMAAACETFIATGSRDGSILIFTNGKGYELAKVLALPVNGMHDYKPWMVWIGNLVFVTNDLLLWEHRDGTLAFTRLSTAKVVARVDVDLRISSVTILPTGQIVCGGYSRSQDPVSVAVLFYPPASVADDVKHYAAGLVTGTSDGNASVSLKRLASKAADCGPTLPPTKKTRLENSGGGSSFKLEELKAAASDPKALVLLNVKELSSVVAGAMIGFEEDSRQHLSLLAECLKKLFGNRCINGDAIVEFPCSELLGLIMDSLKKDEAYVLEGGTTRLLEWHLQRFLQRLRSHPL